MVIQRLQNLYLLIAIALMGMFCFMPFLQFTSSIADYDLSVLYLKTQGISDSTNAILNNEVNSAFYTYGYFSIGILICILLLTSLCLYKNLKVQKRIAIVSAIILICFYISTGIYSWFIFQSNGMETWQFKTAVIFPPLSLIFLGLAIRSMVNDQRLLSASSRIR